MSDSPEVELCLPPAVRPFVGGRASLRLAAADVGALLDAFAALHPAAARMVRDEQGKPRPHLNVFVDLDSIKDRQGLATPLRSGAVVSIVPAVSGG